MHTLGTGKQHSDLAQARKACKHYTSINCNVVIIAANVALILSLYDASTHISAKSQKSTIPFLIFGNKENRMHNAYVHIER